MKCQPVRRAIGGDSDVIVRTGFCADSLKRELEQYDKDMRIQESIMRGYQDYLEGRTRSASEVFAELDEKWAKEEGGS